MMNLYTIVLDFKGGTYTSQVEENSEELAMHKWVNSVDNILPELNIAERSAFAAETDLILTPLSGLQNVWCMSFSIDNSLALMNMIKTKAI